MAQAGLHGLSLHERQLKPPQPLSSLDPEQVRHGRAALQAAHQHGVNLVLGSGASPDQLATARQTPAHPPGPLRRHPHRLELPGPQQPGQRARVEAVGLCPRLRNAGIARGDDDDLAHVRLKQPHDLPRAASHLERDPVGRQQAVGQRLDPLGRRGHPAGRPHLALLADRDLDEVKVHIQPDAPAQRP